MNTPKEVIKSNPYSVHRGVAAEDIEPNSVILKIICPELIPGTSFGTLGAGITEGNVKLKDRDDKPISATIKNANHLVATWEGQTNVRYPPMVRKGEPVEVYKSGDQDKFYWRTKGQGRDFRKTDRIVIEVGASDPNKPSTAKDDTNTYSAYLDSHNKKVGLKTSSNNGEVAAFSMEADLAEGTFHITDNGQDPGNRIFMDTGAKSGVPVFQVNTSTGLTLKFEGDNLYIKVPGKCIVDAKERIVFNSPITVFNTDKAGTVIVNAMTIAINAGKDAILTAGSVIGLNAQSVKVGGVLITESLRAARAVKAALGSLYKAATIQRPAETPVVNSNNAADTSMIGVDYRAP